MLDFNVDNSIYGPQLAGPFPWNAPDRFLSSGILPGKLLWLKQVDVEYSAEARTGFPFYLVNNEQQLVTLPGSHRFPGYFSLNLFLEKRFEFRGRYWAIRGAILTLPDDAILTSSTTTSTRQSSSPSALSTIAPSLLASAFLGASEMFPRRAKRGGLY